MATDLTIRIFDQFYSLDLVVSAGEYEIVYSYFEQYANDVKTAKTFTDTLFRIANITQIPVLELLQTFQQETNPSLTRLMTYYLNSIGNKNVLFGVNDLIAPNNAAARNVINSKIDTP